MSAAHEKAAWVLPTPQAARENSHQHLTSDFERLASLRERAAIAGVQIHIFDDECTGQSVFMVARWGLTRQFESLADMGKWFDLISGVKNG